MHCLYRYLLRIAKKENLCYIKSNYVPIAQLDRASDCVEGEM